MFILVVDSAPSAKYNVNASSPTNLICGQQFGIENTGSYSSC